MVRFLSIIQIIVLSGAPFSAFAKDMEVDYKKVPSRTFLELKILMTEFGEYVGELLQHHKDSKNLEWNQIGGTVQQMKGTLKKMQTLDQENFYKKYTNELEENLKTLKSLSEHQDPAFFGQLDQLQQRCFKCHSTH